MSELSDTGGCGSGAIATKPRRYGMTSGLVTVPAATKKANVFQGYRQDSRATNSTIYKLHDYQIDTAIIPARADFVNVGRMNVLFDGPNPFLIITSGKRRADVTLEGERRL